MTYAQRVERKGFRCSIATATFTNRRRSGTNIFRSTIAISPRRTSIATPTVCSWCEMGNQFQRPRQVEISGRDLASGADQENHRRYAAGNQGMG